MSLSTSVKADDVSRLVTLSSPALKVTLTTLGASVYSLQVYQPQQKKWVEVNTQYKSRAEAMADRATYFGATVGRFAGRISHGRFTLDNQQYRTPTNCGEHTIHGGANEFDRKEWGFTVLQTADEIGVTFNYTSPHMENGFPGELACKMTYSIAKSQPQALRMDFHADITDTSPADASPVNMFNHVYWNLNGFPRQHPDETWAQPETVHNHYLRMPSCDRLVDTDSVAVPNGKLVAATGALDFTKGHKLGDSIDDATATNRDPCGYDHPYYISGWKEHGPMRLNAEISSPSSGILMQVYSTFPCIWVYTANNLKKDANGTPSQRFARHTSVCLEPQQLPDAVNWKSFPQSVARRGAPYRESMLNVFTVTPASL